MTTLTDPQDLALATMATWVASIANNINNPIAGVAAAVAIIEREMGSCRTSGAFHQDLVDEALRRMRERLQMLGEYVTELVEVARPAPIVPASVRVSETLQTLHPSQGFRGGCNIETAIEPGAETVTADPIHFRAALQALVTNGLEAASGIGKPTPQLRLSARRETSRGETGVILCVEDNGPGFLAAGLTRATEPFFSTKEASSGLGLAIAKRFAIAHGGSIHLGSSAILGGAAITIFLPDRSVGGSRTNQGGDPT